MLPWKCHSGNMTLCSDCNNCAKFQFYTEKVFRDIPFFCDFTSFCPQCDVTSNLNRNLVLSNELIKVELPP